MCQSETEGTKMEQRTSKDLDDILNYMKLYLHCINFISVLLETEPCIHTQDENQFLNSIPQKLYLQNTGNL